MTNQQKLQKIYDLTGRELFTQIIQEVGPGTISIPKDVNRARRESRDIAIRADFFSDEFAGMKHRDICRVLSGRYGLSVDRIRKIISQTTSGSR